MGIATELDRIETANKESGNALSRDAVIVCFLGSIGFFDRITGFRGSTGFHNTDIHPVDPRNPANPVKKHSRRFVGAFFSNA
jgi:hypothetical protein